MTLTIDILDGCGLSANGDAVFVCLFTGVISKVVY